MARLLGMMAPGIMTETTFEQEFFDRISDALVVLSEVTAGDLTARLADDLPEDDPFHVLYLGINEMVEALGAADRRKRSYQAELEEKLATIDRQKIAISELSTPVIELWSGVICLPVIGVVDTARSAEMTDALLTAVVDKQARCAIIDVTGIEVMDTGTADHFIRMARAVSLLGAECLLTGIAPAIAQTIVHMGIDMQGVTTHRSLRDALHGYVSRNRPSR